MHLGRKYKFTEYVLWTKWEIASLAGWAFLVTAVITASGLHFIAIPAPLLAIVGTAVAFVLAFKNQQCFARVNEALVAWGQINSGCMTLANKLQATVGHLDGGPAHLRQMYYWLFAWLTSLRFFLRAPKVWENTHEAGNKKYLAALPTPEAQSKLDAELATYLSKDELRQVMAHPGDREGLMLGWQYRTLGQLHAKGLIAPPILLVIGSAVDELMRLQGTVKRLKNYPYARNYYSITLILVKAFVGMVPFTLYQYCAEMGKADGLEFWTVWLNVPFSVLIGWAFTTLEKVGENSSNPFEGGPNDVPISFLSRRIEIEMRTLLGEATELKPIAAKYDILF